MTPPNELKKDCERKAEDILIEKFNVFIKKWCGNSYPHLIDNDDNDGEDFREAIRDAFSESLIVQKRVECKGCGKELLPENVWMEDGCPCNPPKGVNTGLLSKWWDYITAIVKAHAVKEAKLFAENKVLQKQIDSLESIIKKELHGDISESCHSDKCKCRMCEIDEGQKQIEELKKRLIDSVWGV